MTCVIISASPQPNKPGLLVRWGSSSSGPTKPPARRHGRTISYLQIHGAYRHHSFHTFSRMIQSHQETRARQTCWTNCPTLHHHRRLLRDGDLCLHTKHGMPILQLYYQPLRLRSWLQSHQISAPLHTKILLSSPEKIKPMPIMFL